MNLSKKLVIEILSMTMSKTKVAVSMTAPLFTQRQAKQIVEDQFDKS